MLGDIEKAQIMFKLARKGNWNACYDRLEHFKRFENLKEAIKELSKKEWLIIKKKPNFVGVSLNASHKKEIIEFVELNLPELKGYIH